MIFSIALSTTVYYCPNQPQRVFFRTSYNNKSVNQNALGIKRLIAAVQNSFIFVIFIFLTFFFTFFRKLLSFIFRHSYVPPQVFMRNIFHCKIKATLAFRYIYLHIVYTEKKKLINPQTLTYGNKMLKALKIFSKRNNNKIKHFIDSIQMQR